MWTPIVVTTVIKGYLVVATVQYVDLRLSVEWTPGGHASEAACDATAWWMHIRLVILRSALELKTQLFDYPAGWLSITIWVMSTSKTRLMESGLPEYDIMVRATSSISSYKKSSLIDDIVEYNNTFTKSSNLN